MIKRQNKPSLKEKDLMNVVNNGNAQSTSYQFSCANSNTNTNQILQLAVHSTKPTAVMYHSLIPGYDFHENSKIVNNN